jgi:hypothetical protein
MRTLLAFVAVALMTATAAGQTPPAQNHTGRLDGRSARASFEVQLEEGQLVTLTTSSADGLDTVLTLNGPNGRRVAQNDDVQPGILTSRIVYEAQRSGRHTIVVTGFNGAVGGFDLRVAHGLDFGLSEEARTLREERQSFSRRTAQHEFAVDLNAGEVFVASTFALTDGLDTTLALRDSEGAVVAQNDDASEGNFNSQIVYEPAVAGRYVVVASTYTGEGAGNFALSLAIDPKAEAPFNFASIAGAEIARHEGALTDAQPAQEYRVDLAAGQTLFASGDATSGTLDTVLRLRDAEGNPVAINDDRGDGSLNSAFAFTAPSAGAYTLEVSRFRQSNTSGEYRLVLSSVEASVVDTLQALIENQITLSGPEQTIETADFRIYYTLEGRDAATPEYARSVADTMQTVLDAQVARMGWSAPVRGRDGRYRVYVADARGLMGFAPRLQMVFDNPNTANVRETAATRGVLVIDNDFRGMGKKAPPESLMRATATHELNHLVQFGYDADESLQWLYEATASWIETATVGTDQDATDYVSIDFDAPQVCWTTNTYGHDYAQWTLLQSLADSYGEGIVVRLWENSVRLDGFETMTQTLAGVGTTIPDALQRWRVQNFARDYDLAPRFLGSVASAGSINRNGSWSPRARIQQLGAQYVEVRVQGPRAYGLQGDANLELIGLGRRNGEIEAIPLGRGGVFDGSGYDYAALMVFNRAVPAAPGECSEARYSISVAGAQAAPPAAAYRFNARHFQRPS